MHSSYSAHFQSQRTQSIHMKHDSRSRPRPRNPSLLQHGETPTQGQQRLPIQFSPTPMNAIGWIHSCPTGHAFSGFPVKLTSTPSHVPRLPLRAVQFANTNSAHPLALVIWSPNDPSTRHLPVNSSLIFPIFYASTLLNALKCRTARQLASMSPCRVSHHISQSIIEAKKRF